MRDELLFLSPSPRYSFVSVAPSSLGRRPNGFLGLSLNDGTVLLYS